MSYPLNASELDDIRSSYEEELAGLTFNSKPIINMLTTIAQENMNAAGVICKTIEDRIHSAPPTQKLPVMYLLDSISKNVGSPFTPIFARNLYATFMDCYTAVETNTRRSLEALFSTWKLPVAGSNSPVPVYPLEDTRKIDDALLRIRAVQERNTMYQQYAQPPPSRFGIVSPYPQPYPGYPPAAPMYHDPYRQAPSVQYHQPIDSFRPPPQMRNPAIDSLISDIDGLLRTLDTRARLNPDDAPTNTFITSLRGLHEMLRTQNVRPLQLEEIRDQLRKVAVFCAQPMQPLVHPSAGPQPSLVSPPSQDLFAQLAKAGIIPTPGNNTPIPPPMFQQQQQQPQEARGPLIELNSNAMLQSRPELIDLLYSSMPLQCYQCGHRWKDTPEQRALKDEHLDWHFRTNKRLREHSVRTQSRALFLSETDWIHFSISDDGDPELPNETKQAGPDVSLSTVPKPSDPALHDSVCPICKEPFVTDWDDTSEDWVWKNAVNVNNTIFHALCHADTLAAQKKAAAGKDESQSKSGRSGERSHGVVEAQEDGDDDDDEDIALPMADGSTIKPDPESIVDQASGSCDIVHRVPKPEPQSDVIPGLSEPTIDTPFVLEDALKSLSGTLNALSGLKRKASEEAESQDRRIKIEPGIDEA